MNAEVVAVASVQEEIGLYGARGAAFGLDPSAAIAVDVTHATDTPGVSKNENGDHALGSGPAIKRATNLSPIVSEGLIAAAEEAGISYTLEADSRSTVAMTTLICRTGSSRGCTAPRPRSAGSW